MLSLIIVILVTVLLCIGTYKYRGCDRVLPFGIGFCLFIITLLTMLYCWIKTPIDAQYQIEQYNDLAKELKAFKKKDSKVLYINLDDKVLRYNNIISEHKILSHNIWTNLWYSEEVGNLPKLSLYE